MATPVFDLDNVFDSEVFGGVENQMFDSEVFDGNVFDEGTAGPAASSLKYWNGSMWATGTLRYWNGSAWVQGTLRHWDGSAWVIV